MPRCVKMENGNVLEELAVDIVRLKIRRNAIRNQLAEIETDIAEAERTLNQALGEGETMTGTKNKAIWELLQTVPERSSTAWPVWRPVTPGDTID